MFKADFKRNHFANWLHHWFFPNAPGIPGTFAVTDDFGNAVAVNLFSCAISLTAQHH